MIYLFSPRGRQALRRLKEDARPLLAFDFDGTLVKLSLNPESVTLRKVTRDRLRKLTRQTAVAIITGRSVADVRQWTEPFPFFAVVGNHGIERSTKIPKAPAYREIVKDWILRLSTLPEGEPCVWIENKRFSLSLHYRSSPKPLETRARIIKKAKGLRGAHIVPGKDVINLVPKGAPDKGTAFRALVQESKARHALFAGDDVTDESVFKKAKIPGCEVITVRVGRASRLKSKAEFYLKDQREMDKLLGELLRK